jgi:hypothetical protein
MWGDKRQTDDSYIIEDVKMNNNMLIFIKAKMLIFIEAKMLIFIKAKMVIFVGKLKFP